MIELQTTVPGMPSLTPHETPHMLYKSNALQGFSSSTLSSR